MTKRDAPPVMSQAPGSLVSVVMIAYNVGPFITQAIDSVLAQDQAELELIVVDDESTDDSWDRIGAAAARDPRVRPLRIPHAGHPAHTRNAGLQIARGEFVTFLDGDDFYRPGRIQAVAALFAAHPDLQLVFHDTARVDMRGQPTGVTYLTESNFLRRALPHLTSLDEGRYLAGDRFDAFNSAIFCGVHTSSITVRRAWLERQPSFFDASLLGGGEDLDLWYRLLRGARVGFIDAPLAAYRTRPGSITTDRRRFIEGTLQADVRNMARYAAILTPVETDYYRRRIARRYRHLGTQEELQGDPVAARRAYRRSFGLEPRLSTGLVLAKSFLPRELRLWVRARLGRARREEVPVSDLSGDATSRVA